MKHCITILFLITITNLNFGQGNHSSKENDLGKTHNISYSEYQKIFSSLKTNPYQPLSQFQKLDSFNLETYLGEDTYKTYQSRQWMHNDIGQITNYLYYKEITNYGMVLDFKIDYTYNNDFDKATKKYSRRNAENELAEYSKNNYTWDSDHRLIEDFYLVKNINSEEFENKSHSIYSWNSENQIEGIVINDWDSEQNLWLSDEHHSFYYSNSGLLDSVLIQYWITEDESWKDFYLYKYEYNANQKMINEKAYIQYIGIEYWEKRYKIEYVFNEEEVNIERISFSVNSVDDSWLNNKKTAWSYDELGNITEAIRYDWDTYNESWITIGKNSNSYDYNYSIDEVIIPIDYDLFTDIYEYHEIYNAQNPWLNSLFYLPNDDSQEWEHTGRTSLHYSSIEISNTDDLKPYQVSIHPNPTSNLLYIDSDERAYSEIFNLTGEKVYSTYNHVLDLTHLIKGIYFVKIKVDEKQIRTEKIIKL